MTKTALINAKEVAEILGTSKSHAYKVVQQLNEELRNQGYKLRHPVENAFLKLKRWRGIATHVMRKLHPPFAVLSL